jgi:SecDF, P1 head subdomain
MTITEFPPTGSDVDGATGLDVDEAQLLFREARRRRRRRWLISGIVTVAGLLLLGAIAGIVSGRGQIGPVVSPAPVPPPARASTPTASQFSVRPVLCFAPPASASAPLHPGTPLPACTAASALSAGNLRVDPASSSLGGMSEDPAAVPPDPQFASFPSTTSARDAPDATVILPGVGGADTSVRYVLGPAGLTAGDVRAATVQLVTGEWRVNLTLTESGSARWDALARQQFHALVGVVVDNQVISAPINEPTQSTFLSFSGRLQIAAGLTRRQAMALAARL